MYTIRKLAAIANISTRTLRYYDEIGLLKPTSYMESGYRLYDEVAVDMLQQILLYKTMGMPLNEIHQVIYKIDFNLKEALLNHKHFLQEEEK
jgi:DNA-binding transcriptional MerR regulator